MALYGAYSSAMLGMMSQAKALHNISTNIANVNTGGFKGTDTRFSTVLSKSLNNVSDIGGVRPKGISTVSQQGNIVASESSTDVAIAGKGFFVMNTKQDGTGDSIFGRDGSLEIATVNDISVIGNNNTSVTTKDGYLVDKNGYFIQGWAYTNGSVTTTSTPASLRVDQYAFTDKFETTTTAALNLNLPAGDKLNNINQYDISLYDSTGAMQTVKLNFSRTAALTWDVTTTTSQTPSAQVDTLTLGGTVGEVGDKYNVTVNGRVVTYTTTGAEADINAIRDGLITAINGDPQMKTVVTAAAGAASGTITLTADTAGNALTTTTTATNGGATADNTMTKATTTANVSSTITSAGTALTFKSDGTISTPTSLALNFTFDGGGTTATTLDISDMTQFYGDFLPISYTKNGFAKSTMKSFGFDATGNIVGTFEDNTFRDIYKLSLGVFSNPNGLESVTGNVYRASADSGSVTITSAEAEGYASFMPNARELSNVDIGEQFTKMMVTQTAYNSASTVFRTVDEMTTVARDLKR